MFHSLQDLIHRTRQQSRLRPQLDAAHVVSCTDEFLKQILPPGGEQDAWTRSFREGTITIACHHSAVAHFIHEQEQALIAFLHRRIPSVTIQSISVQIGSKPETWQEGQVSNLSLR